MHSILKSSKKNRVFFSYIFTHNNGQKELSKNAWLLKTINQKIELCILQISIYMYEHDRKIKIKKCLTMNDGQFIAILTPWLLDHHFKSFRWSALLIVW